MSKMMKKIAIVENLMGKRPSGRATGSLPHSNAASLTAVRRRGAMSNGMPMRSPPTPAAMANTRKTWKKGNSEPPRLRFGVIGGTPQRPRLHVGESELAADVGQLAELVRMVVPRHRQGARGRGRGLGGGEGVHA